VSNTTEPSVITRLRARSAHEPTVLTIPQLRRLRDELRMADATLDRTARLVGTTPEQVVATVSELGKWLLQSNKLELPTLVSAAEYQEQVTAWNPASGRYREHAEGQLSMFNMPAKPKVSRAASVKGQSYIAPAPDGFLDAGGPALHKPVAALLAHDISDDQIDRWVARAYTASLPMLTFPVVAAVWRMATLGMLDKLDEVSNSPSFAKVAVEAWELLEYARRDALASVAELTGKLLSVASTPLNGDGRARTAEQALRLARQSRWLCEQDLRRVARAAQALADEPKVLDTFVGELRYLRQRARTHPEVYRISDISQIREGQMIRIAQLAGLPTEEPDPQGTADIRRKVRALQLGRDADQLVPNAVVASQAGRLDQFMTILEARASGDVTWLGQMLALAAEPREMQPHG
jgi:hypothetical protein